MCSYAPEWGERPHCKARRLARTFPPRSLVALSKNKCAPVWVPDRKLSLSVRENGLRSIVSQRHHRVYARRSARGQISGD
jgi:hypothetical protein